MRTESGREACDGHAGAKRARPSRRSASGARPLAWAGWLLAWAAVASARSEKRPEPPLAPTSSSAAPGSPAGEGETRALRPGPEPARPQASARRERMVERMVERQIESRGVTDAAVLRAMREVPRHRFVLPEYRDVAYSDRPLPIVGGQTISQPYIVAFMTEAAAISEGARCLEIGTGSGYQAAVLSELCAETYSIEYLPEVAAFGRDNLERAGYLARSLHLRVGDGYAGWPERAPFDAILVTAAPERVPEPLLAQLAVGGKLVIPVGPERGAQTLELWTRLRPGNEPGALSRRELFGVRFVPFLGREPR